MKPLKLFWLPLFFIITSFISLNDFLSEQKKFERVRTAYKEKGSFIEEQLHKSNIRIGDLQILINVYKEEQELEIYAKSKGDKRYKKLSTYKICESSGVLGPKRRKGDYQVPEGFYYVDRFNPASSFYLSLGINYPNKSDRIKSSAKDLGGDIFIHGECVTIGCMPMTNDMIKEIYLYAIQAKHNGQNQIPVYIYPFKMTEENFRKYTMKYKDNKPLISFWTNLKSGYDKFFKDQTALKVTVLENGDYCFN
jgi:murein L,D-transpeptidase YafK